MQSRCRVGQVLIWTHDQVQIKLIQTVGGIHVLAATGLRAPVLLGYGLSAGLEATAVSH